MSRKERNEQFIASLDNVSNAHLLVTAKKRYEFNDMTVDTIKQYLKDTYAEKPDSWLIDDIATEYDMIKHLNGDNLQIWSNYRKYGNYDEPIAKPNGDFLAVSFKGIEVNIDGIDLTITNTDYVNIPANGCDNSGNECATISFAMMQKLFKIKEHMVEIARYVN